MSLKTQFITERVGVELIDTDKLKLRDNRVRQKISWKSLQPLMRSLRLFGFSQPIEVNNKNEVVLGNRRLEAAKLGFVDKIPVIRSNASDYEAIQKELFSDLSTEKLSLREKAEAFREIMKQTGMTKYALANYLGLSHTSVCKTLSLLNASKKTEKLIEEGKISEKKVAMVLYRLKDKSKEDYIINEIIRKKLDIVQAGNLVAEINNPEIFKKHFLARIKAFKTLLNNFEEKRKTIKLDEKETAEIKAALDAVKKAF